MHHLIPIWTNDIFSYLQETAAALSGVAAVTAGHAHHPGLPSLLTAPPTGLNGGGRRPRPLPAHMSSTAPWAGAGSPFNRRTHRCDYPDCDKVTPPLLLYI